MYDVNDIVENYINCSEGVKKVTVQYLRTITGCENEDNRELLFNTALYLRNNNYFIVVKKDYLICYVDPEERFKFENRLKGFSLLYSLLIGVLLSVVAFSLYYHVSLSNLKTLLFIIIIFIIILIAKHEERKLLDCPKFKRWLRSRR